MRWCISINLNGRAFRDLIAPTNFQIQLHHRICKSVLVCLLKPYFCSTSSLIKFIYPNFIFKLRTSQIIIIQNTFFYLFIIYKRHNNNHLFVWIKKKESPTHRSKPNSNSNPNHSKQFLYSYDVLLNNNNKKTGLFQSFQKRKKKKKASV